MKYDHLVAALRAGAVVSDDRVLEILRQTGRHIVDLAVALTRPEPPRGPQPGSPCDSCGEPIVVRSSRRTRGVVVQYLTCPACGARAGRRVVAESSIRRRQKRTVVTTPNPSLCTPATGTQ